MSGRPLLCRLSPGKSLLPPQSLLLCATLWLHPYAASRSPTLQGQAAKHCARLPLHLVLHFPPRPCQRLLSAFQLCNFLLQEQLVLPKGHLLLLHPLHNFFVILEKNSILCREGWLKIPPAMVDPSLKERERRKEPRFRLWCPC